MNKLRFASYNCKGFKNRNYDYLIDLFKEFDLQFLQETWLHAFQENLISQILIDSNFYHVSGMSSSDISKKGRPHGGVAIIYHSSLQIQLFPIVANSNRICASKVVISEHNFLLMSVYMPVNDGSSVNIQEFEEVLIEISSILRSHDDCVPILGGDFNLDLVRDCNSNTFDIFKRFVDDEYLLCHDEIFYLQQPYYTYESSTGLRSSIDHFVFNNDHKDNVNNFRVLIDGNNLSDHQPICIEYNLGRDTHIKEPGKFVEINSINWKRPNDGQIRSYKTILDEMLSSLSLPVEVVDCNDMLCKSHENVIVEYMEDIINAIKLSAELTIP